MPIFQEYPVIVSLATSSGDFFCTKVVTVLYKGLVLILCQTSSEQIFSPSLWRNL